MKRKVTLLLGMVFAVSALLAGCGGSGDRVASDKTTQEENNVQMEDNLQTEDSLNTEGNLKTGIALVTDISGSADAAEGEGLAQADVTIAAVTVDADGKIITCAIDSVQTKINFAKDGKITTDLDKEYASKQELGEAYGMKNASQIGKEWNEQADAFAAYCVGKTAEEVKGIALTEAGKAADADLAASCSISIGSFQDLVVKAVNNAK